MTKAELEKAKVEMNREHEARMERLKAIQRQMIHSPAEALRMWRELAAEGE